MSAAAATATALNREAFKSNTAHARFAGFLADVYAAQDPEFDRATFVLAAMPRAWVGTRHANVWEREARKGAA